MTFTDENGRRIACIINCAAPGFVRAGRGLIGRAIRTALGVKSWRTGPHCVVYVRSAEVEGGQPRFIANVTDDELTAIIAEANRLAKVEGWENGAPIDCYHD